MSDLPNCLNYSFAFTILLPNLNPLFYSNLINIVHTGHKVESSSHQTSASLPGDRVAVSFSIIFMCVLHTPPLVLSSLRCSRSADWWVDPPAYTVRGGRWRGCSLSLSGWLLLTALLHLVVFPFLECGGLVVQFLRTHHWVWCPLYVLLVTKWADRAFNVAVIVHKDSLFSATSGNTAVYSKESFLRERTDEKLDYYGTH